MAAVRFLVHHKNYELFTQIFVYSISDRDSTTRLLEVNINKKTKKIHNIETIKMMLNMKNKMQKTQILFIKKKLSKLSQNFQQQIFRKLKYVFE